MTEADQGPSLQVSRRPMGVSPSAVVLYATEKTKPNTKMILCQSIDTGETRPTKEGIVQMVGDEGTPYRQGGTPPEYIGNHQASRRA